MAGGGDAGRLERLDEAITVLASSGVYLSREELLDALWLAGRLPERDAAGGPPGAAPQDEGRARAPGPRPADHAPRGLYGGGHTPGDRPGGADAEPPDTRR